MVTDHEEGVFEYRLIGKGNMYRAYKNGLPYIMEIQEIISEKSVFTMNSEREIAEIGVKKEILFW